MVSEHGSASVLQPLNLSTLFDTVDFGIILAHLQVLIVIKWRPSAVDKESSESSRMKPLRIVRIVTFYFVYVATQWHYYTWCRPLLSSWCCVSVKPGELLQAKTEDCLWDMWRWFTSNFLLQKPREILSGPTAAWGDAWWWKNLQVFFVKQHSDGNSQMAHLLMLAFKMLLEQRFSIWNTTKHRTMLSIYYANNLTHTLKDWTTVTLQVLGVLHSS